MGPTIDNCIFVLTNKQFGLNDFQWPHSCCGNIELVNFNFFLMSLSNAILLPSVGSSHWDHSRISGFAVLGSCPKDSWSRWVYEGWSLWRMASTLVRPLSLLLVQSVQCTFRRGYFHGLNTFLKQVCWKLAQRADCWCDWSWPYWVCLRQNDGNIYTKKKHILFYLEIG